MRVDKNYSYDELEGFENVRGRQWNYRPELMQATVCGHVTRFSKTAIEALGDPDYVRVKVNWERRLLLVYKSDALDPDAIRVRCMQKCSVAKNAIDTVTVMKVIEKLSSRDLGTVNLIANGTKSKKLKDAVIFDFRGENLIVRKNTRQKVKP